ncbi:MAG TPA: DNA helicase RecQ [Candidatus Acidoferrales bacterium]|nr:DNA helicase RecQ [Candidatus Acidoferrales bacterium]
MTTASINPTALQSSARILATVKRYWGFDRLRPLQEQAIQAGLEQRDSLVVLPTGGGKSLCYQVPAELAQRTDVVVSPLISLMKDQVDGLRECGYPAAALYSGMPADAVRDTENKLAAGTYRLAFVAPERLLTPRFLQLIERLQVRAFAIDEAHCISHWGHDFRPEYRQLAELKTRFPQASVHAYTATATERVRTDIVEQLRLKNPAVLVGTFDRPNLVYRVVPRVDVRAQVLEALRRHAGQAAIVYCISRKDAEAMADDLRDGGVRAAHYHAGMEADERRKTQDAFAAEQIDVVAATVAFGMGIDRSDVRCVIHAAMPKSIEHYQQETGRAGRDGLEAECVLFYSAADAMRWESLIEKSAAEAPAPAEVIGAAQLLLAHMRRFCTGARCRHRTLSEYFGQRYPTEGCGACDVCLNEVEGLADATVTAQKILSCVARAGERFGAEHIVDVLLGANTERVRRWHHEQLSTYGLLKSTNRKALTNMLYQLLDEGLLERTAEERPVLRLNDAAWAVLRGQRTVRLLQPKTAVTPTRVDAESWEGVDRGLFDSLRELRRTVADERGVPAYVVFGDATLRDMARVRPGSPAALLNVRGIGERKLADLGPRFLEHIGAYCRAHQLALDAAIGGRPRRERKASQSDTKRAAFALLATGSTVEQVSAATGRALGTVWGYLAEFVAAQPPDRLDAWIPPRTYHAVTDAAKDVGGAYLKPLFERLGGRVPYEHIRVVLAYRQAKREA